MITAAENLIAEISISDTVAVKERRLRNLMRSLKSVLVAFSGGVDSAYLALIAAQELDHNAFCVIGVSPSLAAAELANATELARTHNFQLEQINTDELANPDYQANPINRCYFCKTELYGKLQNLARERDINFVIDGANLDDTKDYRPGRQAASEKQIRSPLIEVELNKSEIRELSRRHNLPTWDKPASPCLSSRIAYGVPVSIERLSKVERGEKLLREMGLKIFRVRVHDELVRIEIAPDEMERILQKGITDRLAQEFRALGFRYVTLDLHGFRSGAMNEILSNSE